MFKKVFFLAALTSVSLSSCAQQVEGMSRTIDHVPTKSIVMYELIGIVGTALFCFIADNGNWIRKK